MRRLLVLALGLAACTPRADAPPAEDATTSTAGATVQPNVVHVKTTDFAFGMPDTIPSGLTTFHMMNDGKEFHHVTVIRFDQGHTLSEYLSRGEGEAPAEWAHWVGGPNAAFPGATNEATVDLEPGSYGVVCYIPSSDGVPHIAKGMSKAFTVVEQPGAPTVLPDADVTMTFTDYDFTLSQPLTVGKHVMRFENSAQQLHEVWIAKLAPGKTQADVMTFLETMNGEPPVVASSGVTNISPGETVQIPIDIEAGDYILMCFVPDATDGKPHFMHGMVKTVSVGS